MMTLSVSWLKLAVMERRAAQEQQVQLQAEWLAESALDRAASRLDADGEYAGETWRVSAEEIGGLEGGEVLIRIAAVNDQPQRRLVQVQADYPTNLPRRHRCSKSLTIEVVPTKSDPKETTAIHRPNSL
jgi:hypothetical protein